jgi:hypothetical protein
MEADVRRAIHPPAGKTSKTREGDLQNAVGREDRSFGSVTGRDIKADLLAFLDAELHQPLLTAEPHPLSEKHRRHLVNAQGAISTEMERLQACESGEDVALTFLSRIESGDLDAFDEDVRYLGFRSIKDLGRELADRAQAAGIDFRARPTADHGRPHEPQTVQEHQDRLLDEGIEETFPASDPVSVPKVGNTDV